MEEIMEFLKENGKKIAIAAGGLGALAIGGIVVYVSKKKGEVADEVEEVIDMATEATEVEEEKKEETPEAEN